MSAPGWSRALRRRLAPAGREDEILGDLEEAHRAHVQAKGRTVGGLLAAVETVDMAFALLRQRRLAPDLSLLDFKLGVRMLVRYPGLTALGGLAIAMLAVMRRPLVQVAFGLLAGGLLAGFLLRLAGSMPSLLDVATFVAYLAGMAAICMLGCLAPARRALAVEPAEALRAE